MRAWPIAAGVLFGAALIVWHVGGDGAASVGRAQEDTWTTDTARQQGIRLVESRAPGGAPAYPIAPGDLLFFTNSGTSYGARNRRNSVVVIDAKGKKPIAVSDLEPEWTEGWISHGIGVSPDARYVYLPGQAAPMSKRPSSILVLDARTLRIAQIIATGERPHHLKVYEDWMGRRRVLGEDFNWINFGVPPPRQPSPPGKGFYVLDPSDNNKVVAGMTPGDFRGNPYAGFTAPDGRYLYVSVTGPIPALRDQMKGWLAKVDMQSWTIVQFIPMERYPLWTTFTEDGRYAWITQSGDSKVLKLERAREPGQMDRVIAEVGTGPGPYALAMTVDDREVWVADKGEGVAPAQRRTTVTVIDAGANRITRTIETGCVINDHIIPAPDGREMWITCNGSHEVVVLDRGTYQVKARVPMPNQGDSHGGSFVAYTRGAGGAIVGEVVADQNGLHGSARVARREGRPWTARASR
ncbi:MAG: YncE family protein [Acidobacteria bacterium]|nr:YncE family protein [Acidobacteriota bacterium]